MSKESYLTAEQAIAMLPDGDEIHTYMNPAVDVLAGANWSRERVVELIESGAQCGLAGPLATRMGHGLVVMHETGPLFVETREGQT